MSEITLKAADVSFQNIKDLIGNSLAEHQWPVDNGGKVTAQIKITQRAGLIHTKYLHITITKPDGSWSYYREQAGGQFKLISSSHPSV